jgi:hypothetical protein
VDANMSVNTDAVLLSNDLPVADAGLLYCFTIEAAIKFGAHGET